MRYKSKREYQWSGAMAYAVGLIASDGCLSKDGRHIDLTSKDVQILENFCLAINRKFPIREKTNGRGQIAYHVQFSDVALYDFLISCGLMPAKSLVLKRITNLPDEYYIDFLRGLFDGDGSVYGYLDKRWRQSYMFYITFTSASPKFIDFVRFHNSRFIGVSAGSIHKAGSALQLSYAKKDATILYKAMYKNNDVLYLSRKKEKIEDCIDKSKSAIISRQNTLRAGGVIR